MTDPHKTLSTVYGTVLFIGGMFVVVGLIAVLFDVRFLGLRWNLVLFGVVFLVLAHFIKQRTLIDRRSSKSAFQSHLSQQQSDESIPPIGLNLPLPPAVPRAVSFVPPANPAAQPESVRREMVSKSLTPEILNLRFVAYRCEIAENHFKAIYQNATQRELKWFEISSLVIRQFPIQAPWEGKLLLDIVPIVLAGEKVQPVRLLSSTFVNYGFMPQGQSASTKENIRRLANFILLQNRSIFIDPATDSFVQAGQAPVRFLSMAQFAEYDSRYG